MENPGDSWMCMDRPLQWYLFHFGHVFEELSRFIFPKTSNVEVLFDVSNTKTSTRTLAAQSRFEDDSESDIGNSRTW